MIGKCNTGGVKSSGLYVWKKYENVSLINFTINGTSYQAEEGMTWGEWVASSYNTYGLVISSDGKVKNKFGSAYIANRQVAITSDDIIKPNYEYLLVSNSGGSN